jgi:hypothetical protein
MTEWSPPSIMWHSGESQSCRTRVALVGQNQSPPQALETYVTVELMSDLWS